MPPHISVVIPSHNREKDLNSALSTLLAQSYPRARYEIVVIDDSTPPARLAVRSRAIRLVHIPPTSHTRARNEGIRLARGEIVAFTDDDCVPEKTWLEELARAFADPGVSGVEGRTVAGKIGVHFHATQNLTGGCYPTCNMAFRKAALEEVGGFDEAYGFFREDTDLAFAVLQRGGRIVFAPHAVVRHPPRRVGWWQPLRELRMIKSDIRLARKFPSLYRTHCGRVGGGGVKMAGLVWALSAMLIVGTLSWAVLAAVSLALLVAFKYAAHLRRRLFSPGGYVSYIAVSWLRDLLYPFFFLYYALTARALTQP